MLPKASSLHWSREYRKLNSEPYTIFPEYPYLYEIYDQFVNERVEKKVVVRKSAQIGLSELSINVSLWFLDNCGDVMYLLPTDGDASDFSAGRLNPSIEDSEHLADMFDDNNNVGHKRAGTKNYYLRGTQSRNKLKSVPIDFIIMDEFDEMVQDNVALALTRLDASRYKWKLYLSTPTYPDFGIDAEYKKSDQRKWFVECEECGTEQTLDFFQNVLPFVTDEDRENDYVNCKLRCKECESELDEKEGYWKSTADSNVIGFQINQLMSPTVTVQELVRDWFDAQGDVSKIEEFYNSRLGLAYVAEGDKLEVSDIKNRVKDITPSGTKRSMGVDVGSYLHYVISEPEDAAFDPDDTTKNTIKIGKTHSFDDLERYIKNYNVRVCIIDCRPETRKARELAEKIEESDLDCTVLLCEYRDNYKLGYKVEEEKNWIYVDRTESLDKSLGRFQQGTITIPNDVSQEYIDHLTSLVRVIEDKRNGGKIARYKNTDADHYAHANNYDEQAFRLLNQVEQSSVSFDWD